MPRPFPDLSGRTVLQVIPDLAAGGAERTVIEIAEALAEAGAQALVASRGGRLEGELEAVGGRLIRLNAATKNPIAMRGNAARLAKLIGENGVDLIHARSRAPAWSSLWAARRTGIAYVTTYHGAYSAKSVPKRLYNSVMARGDRVIANSDWIARHVSDYHRVAPDRLITIPRGVDTALFDPLAVTTDVMARMRFHWGLASEDDRHVLLLPGRLTAWKGQEIAIEAFAALPQHLRSGAVLVLMGDAQGRDGYVDGLRALIATHRLEDAVCLASHSGDMAAAYGAADIVLCPSTRPEAFGRTAAEASAMARPVIAFAHGGALETVIDGVTGRLVPVSEPGALGGIGDGERAAADLSSAMAELIGAPAERRAAMGAAGRAHILQGYTKRGLQAATLRVYAELLADAPTKEQTRP